MYAADDVDTALAETWNGEEALASCATFETLSDLLLVDLTEAPPCPSILARGTTCERGESDFLLGLIIDISKSIEKDDRIHTEYVPTQVVAEYVRHKLKLKGRSVDGIVYSSSKGRGDNCVFFVDTRSIEGSGAYFRKEAKFRLVDVERRRLQPS
jgi:hypothetical protein